ncbi:MAG: hypothetical protein HQL19_07740 [Candidatus Omnitrophica bacterium]|nr:hypothetical protein [Candidatus Omnitrophota bacterium]
MAACYFERRLIGEILVERGAINADQLKKALEVQRASPDDFVGEVLMRLGYVTEIDIVTALVLQCNLPYIAVSKHQVDASIIRLIPVDMARRNRIIPLDRIGNILSVVMLNPLNEAVRHEVETFTDCRIATFISTKSEIDLALARFYPEEK